MATTARRPTVAVLQFSLSPTKHTSSNTSHSTMPIHRHTITFKARETTIETRTRRLGANRRLSSHLIYSKSLRQYKISVPRYLLYLRRRFLSPSLQLRPSLLRRYRTTRTLEPCTLYNNKNGSSINNNSSSSDNTRASKISVGDWAVSWRNKFPPSPRATVNRERTVCARPLKIARPYLQTNRRMPSQVIRIKRRSKT